MSSQPDLPWPSPGASHPLESVDALPCPSSCGDVAFDAHRVKLRAKRPRDTAERPSLCVPALVFPATPQPHLDLLGVESPGDLVCTGRLPAAAHRCFPWG